MMVPGVSLCAGVVGGLTSVMHDPGEWFTGEGVMKKMDPAIRTTRLLPLLPFSPTLVSSIQGQASRIVGGAYLEHLA